MKLMHTKLPEFIRLLKRSATEGGKDIPCDIKGLENLDYKNRKALERGAQSFPVRWHCTH